MYKCFNINLGNDEYVENCETINKYLNLKETQEMFCYKSKLKTLNTLNLDNLGTNITCYTFLNNLDFNILNSNVINTKNNIYVDFLKFISVRLHNNDNYKVCIKDYRNIKKHIIDSCNKKLQRDILHVNHKTCFILLKQILTSCPERFNNLKINKILSVPFENNDIIYCYYTIKYKEYIKSYKINYILVTDE